MRNIGPETRLKRRGGGGPPPPVNICWFVQFDMLDINDEIISFSFDFSATSGATSGTAIVLNDTLPNVRTGIENLNWDDAGNSAFMIWDNLDVERTDIGGGLWHYTIIFTNPRNSYDGELLQALLTDVSSVQVGSTHGACPVNNAILDNNNAAITDSSNLPIYSQP